DRAARSAAEKLGALREEHGKYTRSWALADDRMKEVMKRELDRLNAEITVWEVKTKPIRERLETDAAEFKERDSERERLLDEWNTVDGREKGAVLRRLIKSVKLFWKQTWHPAEAKPSRPRRTDRPGRNKYELETDKIQWEFLQSDLPMT